MNDNLISVGERKEKHPREMVNIELLEKYGHYTRMPIRMPDQQDYIALLRREMLQRMESKKE
ncbi:MULTISPECIES: hypothetical protein [unclassified Sporosarcina]|uniref:hypothetical protein n=1 Tax=unclassified Sporosarcina TaxID=2647733 RepID=UPI00203D847E|nr:MULTISPECIES: hypothetical protein [unclassified Sporosarcina]GKV67463.1 hypothetical protein NCCP2331_36160 [Sporosarcina sp. NCCP-2331]GLB57825.1 hypothetical protein NCCP2378_36190 [Sporosarcina sp. NCCP-2378]